MKDSNNLVHQFQDAFFDHSVDKWVVPNDGMWVYLKSNFSNMIIKNKIRDFNDLVETARNRQYPR